MARTSDRTLDEFAAFLGVGLEAERSARLPGWLQRRDPRAKVLSLAIFLVTISLARDVGTLAVLYVVGWAAALTTGLSAGRLLRREWMAALFFTGLVALPVLFSGVSPGRPLVSLPWGATITVPGVWTVSRLLLRAAASVHAVLTLTHTTPWNQVLSGLRGLGVPATAVMVLNLAHRYLYLLVRSAREMVLAHKARRVGRLSPVMARRQVASSAGTLLLRSQETATAVHSAMLARGYRGQTRTLQPSSIRGGDVLLAAASMALLALSWIGHHAY